MIFPSYLQKQIDRYEQGLTSDAVYRMASHIEALSVERLRLYDLGLDFSKEEKSRVLKLCKELVE